MKLLIEALIKKYKELTINVDTDWPEDWQSRRTLSKEDRDKYLKFGGGKKGGDDDDDDDQPPGDQYIADYVPPADDAMDTTPSVPGTSSAPQTEPPQIKR